MRLSQLLSHVFGMAAAALTLVAGVSAQNYKLSGAFTMPVTGWLREAKITPDGTRAVYRAHQDNYPFFELYSVPTDGSQSSVRLNRPLGPNRHVAFFTISPDGRRAVFTTGPQTFEDGFLLYSAPLDGSQRAVQLNGPLVPGGSVGRNTGAVPFQISSDGQRVVYLADQDTNDQVELYSVPIGGGHPPVRELGGEPSYANPLEKLNHPLHAQADVGSFRLSPDGEWVVYYVGSNATFTGEIFSVPIDGSAPAVTLNGPLPVGRVTRQYEISPDSSRVVFRMDQDVGGLAELYSVPVAGGAAATILDTAASHPHGLESFQISPDSRRVVYSELVELVQPQFRHFESVPIDGSQPAITLSTPLAAVESFQISPDSRCVVYLGRRTSSDPIGHELASIPIDRSSAPTILRNRGSMTAFRISPDSRRVVFVGRWASQAYELFSVPLDGGPPRVRRSGANRVVKLNAALRTGASVEQDFLISADSTDVVYRTLEAPEEWLSLYRAAIDGSAHSVRLSPGTPEGRVESFLLGAGGRAFYPDYQDNPYALSPNVLQAVPAGSGDLPAARALRRSGGRESAARQAQPGGDDLPVRRPRVLPDRS